MRHDRRSRAHDADPRIGSAGEEVRELAIPREFVGGDYRGDAEFRERFQIWMNAIWTGKAATITRLEGVESA
jgi:hypothetical protein